MLHPRTEADFGQCLFSQFTALLCGRFTIQQRQFNVIDDTQIINQMEALKNETESFIAHLCQLFIAPLMQLLPANDGGLAGERTQNALRQSIQPFQDSAGDAISVPALAASVSV